MNLLWIIIGAFVGAVLGATIADDSTAILGLLSGGCIGFLMARVASLGDRIHRAEQRLASVELADRRASAASVQTAPGSEPVQELRPEPAMNVAAPMIVDLGNTDPVPMAFDLSAAAAPPPPPLPPAWSAEPAPVAAAPIPAPGLVYHAQPAHAAEDPDRVIGAIKRWFTQGNVPVKVGMLVLFAGVAALLKYATDEGWFSFPIEFRLAGIALAALATLVFAWRQRGQRRAFSLSLQGGAIGILLLTVFAAFRIYHLLPASLAFAFMIALVIGICLLAVLQDALALAVLGILAGFAAPILISTGSGNHVALFSYYAILNIAIFAISWWRSWRVLNLLGFLFTFAIGTTWGVLSYKPQLFDSTEPFLILYFGIYLLIPILYAIRRGSDRPGAIDGTLVFANPLIAFSLQAWLLDGERTPLAITAIVLGLIYLVLAALTLRRLRVLGEAYAVLALGFSTLAIPLALSARTTGCVFALEGAALVWLGLRQQRRLPRWIGLLLQVLAALAYAYAFFLGPTDPDALPVANGIYLGALLIALAAFASAWLYQRAGASGGLCTVLYLWGLAWWLGAGLVEIDRHVPWPHESTTVLALFAITAWLAAEAWRIWQRAALAWTTAIGFWLAFAMILVLGIDTQLFADWRLAALLLFAVSGWRSLVNLRSASIAAVAAAHVGWIWSWTVAGVLGMRELAEDAALGSGWRFAMSGLPVLVAFALTLLRDFWISIPLGQVFARYRPGLMVSQVVVLGLILAISLFHPGSSLPLAFVPVLNPLELFQIVALVVLALCVRGFGSSASDRGPLTAMVWVAAFLVISSAGLRAVHHLGGLPWSPSLLSSSMAQTTLTLIWSVLGVAGWVIGSRRGKRALWLVGAVLMAIVLAKLLLVDRQHLGNLTGIVSFIAYGLLCTLVGYLAPAPPRAANQEHAA